MAVTKKKEVQTLLHGIKPYSVAEGEEYMNTRQREHFRKVLLAWKAELIQEVSRTMHAMQDETANHPDPNDRASQETDMSLELRNRERERKLIKKIDEAVSRIDADDYGYCENCGVEIGVQRLEARPTATLCIDCKTLDEIREKQMA
ncbi:MULTISPECIES: RNA polymerase-binding protein DksA [Acidiferrobacter]|jgi:DnaK suppressor protein|uniref:RNA polymerase-binding transcription factor DksA n=2 Tax=Acidiferrobacter TaxID=986106 RepID=A0A1C2FXW3_9GAMM|nr:MULTISPECIES: RNA polymerase-binding protein DksA [Acidiferrobacter]AWP22730.1 RNA polymerase-binding protein DksA [Acidiferrobacter sp. SPIII_3]MDA8190014.1 RNA polymerase-binding protein DksA [Gammaproteobacteria bacterium]RCN56463.1 RNA polymerase-binding protein DksA [Acidiferrobacter thiooxydans]UEN99099.1 RNA polymerase-binding protein DksA [Acidiferrobacter thiooxydans]